MSVKHWKASSIIRANLSHPNNSCRSPFLVFVCEICVSKGSTSLCHSFHLFSAPFAEDFKMRVPSANVPSTFPGLTSALLTKYTNLCVSSPPSRKVALTEFQLEDYIRITNPAPNGSKDLSEIHKGDVICLEGSPCKISSISSTGRLTLVQGTSLIDDIPYAATFNHCYGVTVSTFSGKPDLSQYLVVSIDPPAKQVFGLVLKMVQCSMGLEKVGGAPLWNSVSPIAKPRLPLRWRFQKTSWGRALIDSIYTRSHARLCGISCWCRVGASRGSFLAFD